MEKPVILNLMRSMQVNKPINLELVHHAYADITRLYRGRPEMVVIKMTNGRNMQIFRGGKVQILGRVSDTEASNMRLEFIAMMNKINSMKQFQVSTLWTSNMVVSAQLKKAPYLQKIVTSNAELFHEIELFPAALIRKWHPVHIALFHNGKVILTGLKSIEQFHDIISSLLMFLESSSLLHAK